MDSRRLFLVCAAMAGGGLGLAFFLSGRWEAGLVALAAGGLWVMAEVLPGAVSVPLTADGRPSPVAGRRSTVNGLRRFLASIYLANFWLFLFAGGTAWLLASGLPWWAGIGIFGAALGAWDLHAFHLRVGQYIEPGKEPAASEHAALALSVLTQAHIRALAWALAAGLVLAALARLVGSAVRMDLGLGLIVALGLGVLGGLVLLVWWLAKPT
jgi:hypothetical protein